MNTAQKVALATVASKSLLLARRLVGLGPRAIARRCGVCWELDLREGIDFSIYLLGAFERRTVAAYTRLLRPGQTVVDIGANIGAHALPFARLVGPTGRVLAFEPTVFALAKLRRNMELNPELAPRITVQQRMLTDTSGQPVPPALPSSWPLWHDSSVDPKDCGRPMATEGASSGTLDDSLRELGSPPVHLMKIDVDGNEPSVLRGGEHTIATHRPIILIELAPHYWDRRGSGFSDLLAFLGSNGYRLRSVNTGRPLPLDAAQLRARIPVVGGINVIAEQGARQVR
jgi:FkbM family methyltransferase